MLHYSSDTELSLNFISVSDLPYQLNKILCFLFESSNDNKCDLSSLELKTFNITTYVLGLTSLKRAQDEV